MDDRRPAAIPVTPADVAALGRDLGSTATAADPVPWGDAGATVRLTLADGRVVAARRLTGVDAPIRAAIVAARSDRFTAAGIDVPHPVAVLGPTADGSTWLTAPWRAGVVGATSLADDTATRRLATAMGTLARQIAAVPANGLAPDRAWVDRDRLAGAAGEWLATLDRADAHDLRPAVARAIEDLRTSWTDDPTWDIVVAHGDFAPINVLLGTDDALTLLDLHDVALAPRLLDVAWWGWVVRFHHPAAWSIGWRDLVLATGLEPEGALDAACARVGLIRCLERAARADTDAARDRWLDRLRVTAGW